MGIAELINKEKKTFPDDADNDYVHISHLPAHDTHTRYDEW